MPPTILLARDHLERAAAVLHGPDERSCQLRAIIERTIGLLDEFQRRDAAHNRNVLDFARYRHARRLRAEQNG